MRSGFQHIVSTFTDLSVPVRISVGLIAAVMAFCGVFGCSYVIGQGYAALPLWLELMLSALLTFVAISLLLYFDLGVGKLARCKADGNGTPAGDKEASSRLGRLLPTWRVGSILLFAAFMGLCWLPWAIANFPGSTYWDTFYQIYQVYPENHPISVIPWEEIAQQTYTDAYLVDHHPVFTTLVYGAFGYLSDQLTGNWMAGVFCFTTLQGLTHILVFTLSVAYLRRIGCPLVVCFGAYLYFCLMPFVSTWALCMVKDSLFGLFLILYFLVLLECVRTRGAFLAKGRSVLALCLCALFLCLTKKTGLFVVVPTAIVMAIVYRQRVWAALSQALVGILALCIVMPLLIFPAANIAPGGAQEVLGPLLQQTARVVKDHPEDIAAEEEEAIRQVLDFDRLADEYAFDFQDSVKYRYNLDATGADLARYLQVYAAQGLRHPDAYFGALMGLAGFYVAPCAYANIRMVTVDTKMGTPARYMLWNPDELDGFRGFLDDAYRAIALIPGLDIPLLIVTYAFWLPCACAAVALMGRLRLGVLLTPYLVLLAFCIISPVYDARYVVPIFDVAPLLFALCVWLVRTRMANPEGEKQPDDPSPEAILVNHG